MKRRRGGQGKEEVGVVIFIVFHRVTDISVVSRWRRQLYTTGRRGVGEIEHLRNKGISR
jgi:hypothetical protein